MKWLRAQLAYNEGNDCVPWPFAVSENGYGVVNRDGKQVSAPNYLCELAHGKAPTPEHETAHGCGRGGFGCMTKRHLRWATPKENAADRLIHGTDNRGTKNNMAKLTDDEVCQIRDILHAKAMKQIEIAAAYSVCKQTITNIKKKLRWAWLA